MKLIQLNTWCNALNDPMMKLFKREQADILMLQEVMSSPEGKSGYFDFLQDTQQASALTETFFSAKHDFTMAGKRIFYGNAILSRSKILSTYDEFTHLEYIKDFGFDKNDYNGRRFQHATIQTPSGAVLNLVNYHGLHVPHSKAGNELTEKHCTRIAEYIGELEGPVVLSGDFNLAPDSLSLVPIDALLRNLCAENKIQTTRNVLAKNPVTVDYIWVSKDITVNRFEVMPDLVSDHAALLLEFEV